MPKNNQPQKSDAVLGGQNSVPANIAVLGGLEGVQMRLASANLKDRVSAISEALKYGNAGLDLVIESLRNKSWQVQRQAYLLLKNQNESQIKIALQELKTSYPYRQVHHKYTLNDGHSQKFASLTISNARNMLITSSEDSQIKFWNLDTKELIYTLVNNSSVKSISIDSDAQFLVSGGNDCLVKLWNLDTKELIHTFVGHSSSIESVSLNSYCRLIASGSLDKTVKNRKSNGTNIKA
ncbi:hypothetical protein F7734_28835 [Scytonema sp. UIC 10036]|uniref:hypothetical protein n=1 Tax=Scytonema sp. UIC 10036 TaxID=2304196 RepID=UPI0012DAB4C3|nr:hypothetical protein [Scytonema sp. UIC 10036]